jgi:2-iminobutanoate/2-iminopropanoate deaminase
MSVVTTHPTLVKVSTDSESSEPGSILVLMPRSNRIADAPQAIGPYSQAIVSPPFVFVSGCLGFDPKTGAFVDGGIEAQVHQALQNLKSVVEASGSEVGKIVKTTVPSSTLCGRSELTPSPRSF